MKRRFRRGVELTGRQFGEQPWVHGALEMHGAVLYLSQAGPHGKPPPDGTLHRVSLKACFGNSISFAGIEANGEQWNAQVWYCELAGSEPPGP
jgi:hypothetical protein